MTKFTYCIWLSAFLGLQAYPTNAALTQMHGDKITLWIFWYVSKTRNSGCHLGTHSLEKEHGNPQERVVETIHMVRLVTYFLESTSTPSQSV